MKKLILVAMVIMTLLSIGIPVWATEPAASSAAFEGSNPLIPRGNPNEVTEVLYESLTRARPGEPDTFHNLAVKYYSATGTFRERLVAKRYFIPNNRGEIYVQAIVTWPSPVYSSKDITIQLIEWDTNGSPIATHTEAGFGNASIGAVKRFTGLNVNKFYFVAVVKSGDGIEADLYVYVSH